MSSVAERLKKERRSEIKIGEITFSGSRLTPEQYSRYSAQQLTDADVCRVHIDGVEGAKESDVIEGGAKTPWKYNREDFSEIIGEKPDWYKQLVEALIKDAKEKLLRKAENEKN